MPFDRIHTVAFTGHRSYCGEADEQLYHLLEQLAEGGAVCFLSGMAQGFDLAAAEAVLRLRRVHRGVRLVAVIPHASQSQSFSSEDRARFRHIMTEADEVILLASTYHRGCYQQRNNYLVDHAATLVAWYDGSRGGTQYTFLRAMKQGLALHNLSPKMLPDLTLFT
ncbi:MAG: DUF1273 family protein [Alistipes sp.]|nr:DUF1273 family protein [Alistipes sp.]